MRIKTILLIACVFVAPPLANARPHGSCGMDLQGEPGFQTNEGSLELVKTNEWLGRLANDLSKRPGFDHVALRLMDSFVECQKLECTFRVGKEGNISKVEVYDSSGSKAVDASVVKFLRDAAPFTASPNNISWERGVLIEFCKIPVADKVQIKVWAHLNPKTRGRDFQLERYIVQGQQTIPISSSSLK